MRRSRRIVALLVVAASATVIGLVGVSQLVWQPEESFNFVLPTAESHPQTLTVTCPEVSVDPFRLEGQGARGGAWNSHDTELLTPAPGKVAIEATPSQPLSQLSAVVALGQGGGELRGLSFLPCMSDRDEHWFASGATTIGEDVVLYLANSGTNASVVTVETLKGLTSNSELVGSVTVPAGEYVTLLPARWFPDEAHLVMRVRADGPGVSAWLHSSALSGERPLGSAWGASTQPTTHAVFPGFSGVNRSTLRVASVTEEETKVTLFLTSEEGTRPVDAGEIRLDPSSTLDIDVADIEGNATALQLVSDQPVVAQVMRNDAGSPWNGTQDTWEARSILSPASPLTTVSVPGMKDLETLVRNQLSASPLRPGAVDTEFGVQDISVRVVIVHAQSPSSSEDAEPTTVTLDGTDYVVKPGGSAIIDCPQMRNELEASAPIYATLLVTAQTPYGPLYATVPLGAEGIPPLSQPLWATN